MVSLDKEHPRTLAREVVTFLPDVVRMLRGVLADGRLPRSAKLEAGTALAYLLSPRNRIINVIPVVGQLDDVAVVAFALRRLLLGAGEPLLREHWGGSDAAFRTLLTVTSALATPGGALRRAAVVRSLWSAARGSGRRATRSGGGPQAARVVDGEVLRRRTDR
ncbi:MAG TPA: DUF1232 domain-containing protein [Frankiaceae bacterium]|nr:DUF1232 domain-containing protein [Frankiaceae bacterium]